jgi:hypothetical protein
MASSAIVALGGVNLIAHAPPGMALGPLSPPHAAFAGAAPGAASSIDIAVVLDVLEPLVPLLSNEHGWALCGAAERRGLQLARDGADAPPMLVGEWDRQATRAAVFQPLSTARAGERGPEVDHPVQYPVDQLLMMYHLAPRRGLLVHAAGLVSAGQGLIFPGVSGAGKSTCTRQFMARGWPALLSDDRIIVRELGERFRAFGTPWPGDARVAVNASAPLGGIFFLARGDRHAAVPLSPQEALPRLLPVTSLLWFERELLAEQLATCERLLQRTPAFELRFRPTPDLVDYLHDFVAAHL